MPTIDRTPVTSKRQALSTARTARLQAQADLAAKVAAAAALARTVAPDDPALVAAQSEVKNQVEVVRDARTQEKSARDDLVEALTAWLAVDVAADVARLPSSAAIVLLPLRIETRFAAATSELWVRVYPDEISADAHEPELSQAEQQAGQAYWEAAKASGREQLAAWQRLLQTYPAPRAAWIVRASDPRHPAASTFHKPPGWSRAVEARLLPDRFVVIATRGGVTRQATGSPIAEPLALSVGPDSLEADQVAIGPGGTLTLDDAVRWTVEFRTAVAAGMGIRVAIDAADLAHGFDRVIVLGVKTSLDAEPTARALGALFDAHHYTSGLAFVPQGTPTNNTPGAPAGYPPSDPNGQRSFAVERGDAIDSRADGDGQVLTRVLGLPGGVFSHVEGAGLREAAPALQMNRVLYAATLGYFLEQLMSPLVSREAVREVGQWFAQWVIPRGLAPAFRVGRVPYGVLPATSLALWQNTPGTTPVQARMIDLLRRFRALALGFAGQAPHVGRSADPDQDLLDVLAMDASAREVRVRQTLGDNFWLNLILLLADPALATWEGHHKAFAGFLLPILGLAPTAHPRVLTLNFWDSSAPYDGPLVDTAAVSETDPLGPRDYITWVRQATIDALRQETLPADLPADVKQVLLYRLLRHSALTEYHFWASSVLERYARQDPGSPPVDPAWREPELVGIVPGTETRPTPWQRFQNLVTIPGLGDIRLDVLIDAGPEAQLRALTAIPEFRDALAALAPLPTAELERLFTESLSAVAYRIDAWITSLANERLTRIREAAELAPGCFVGAYGWVENLRPEAATTVTLPDGRTLRSTPGGYVQAPSMAHAASAAVLRNAYLTHLGEPSSPYAIDLSSAQVRTGRFLLDSVRDGQPLGAALGYRLERALHEQHVEALIDPIRQVAPLVANKIEDSGQPVETVAARNVVDGLALRTLWKNHQLFGVPDGLPATIAHRDVLERELAALDRAVDAVADVLLAESVHQIVRGSTSASGAGLDALAQGTRPPDPDVTRAPTGGTTLTHRLAVVLDATSIAPDRGWPAPTPRAACEPRLDTWIGSLLGDPRNVRCRVQYPDRTRATVTVTVGFDALGLRPLDVLALAVAVVADPSAGELDRRILDAALAGKVPADAAADASFTIDYAADPSWDRATTRTVPELLDVASAIARAVGAMRPLAPTDVVLPEKASGARDATVERDEAMMRAGAAAARLQAVQTALQAAIAAAPDLTPPTPAQASELRRQLRLAALYGVPASYPAFAAGAQEGGVGALPLVDQGHRVVAEIAARLDAAGKASDPAGKAQAVFGRGFQILTGFSFPVSSPAGAELGQALGYGPTLLGGDTSAVDRWLTGAARVRDALGRWRMARLLAETSGAAPATWSVAQLPHRAGASWIALPPAAGESRVSGSLSLVLHAASGSLDSTRPWYGLFLDDWVETIPNASEHTGIAFRYDDTSGEAPQAILVAVPPRTTDSWDFESLLAIVTETLELAKIRALDLEALDPLAQVIPASYLAANLDGDTIATDLATRGDPTVEAMP